MLKIIAEIGINHNGNIDYVYELIRQASIGGADFVKFQLYNSKLLFGDNSRKHNEFTFNQVSQIKQMCDIFEIEFFASVFDEEKLDWCESLNVKRYKIASRTLRADPSLSKKISNTKKQIFASLGNIAKDDSPVLSYPNVKYFQCIPKYPTSCIDLQKKVFSFDSDIVGWSDHCLGVSACLYAISCGASVVEKHFTLNKSMGPHHDHIGSMDLNELNLLHTLGNEVWRVHNLCEGGNE